MALRFGAVDVSRGERIRRERNLRGLDQEPFARSVGVSARTLSRIEGGQSERSKWIPKIEKALGIEHAEPTTRSARTAVTLDSATRLELLTELMQREINEQRRHAEGVIELPRGQMGWDTADLAAERSNRDGPPDVQSRRR